MQEKLELVECSFHKTRLPVGYGCPVCADEEADAFGMSAPAFDYDDDVEDWKVKL